MRRAVVVLLILVACTSSRRSPADPAQATSFGQAAASASNAVTRYEQAASSSTTPAECSAALQQYAADMRPIIDQMRAMASGMDGYMKSAGDAVAGDMECGVQIMTEELAHHESVACTSPDTAANHAEAQRDVDAMLSFTNHMQMRAVQVAGMMVDGGTMGPGQMMDAGWGMGWSDGGWTMADGGMMDFGQVMPGCTYTGDGYQAPDAGYWVDGGWATGGPGSVDGGMSAGALAGGATRCEPPAGCTGAMPMAANYLCPDQTIAGPACVAVSDGTCVWRVLTCP